MTAQRINAFALDDEPLDLGGLVEPPQKPRPKPDKTATRADAERLGFTSREPAVTRPMQRRHTTGRNRQLNLKVTEAALTRFYTLAERQEWVLGQAFEEAVKALEEKLAKS